MSALLSSLKVAHGALGISVGGGMTSGWVLLSSDPLHWRCRIISFIAYWSYDKYENGKQEEERIYCQLSPMCCEPSEISPLGDVHGRQP